MRGLRHVDCVQTSEFSTKRLSKSVVCKSDLSSLFLILESIALTISFPIELDYPAVDVINSLGAMRHFSGN